MLDELGAAGVIGYDLFQRKYFYRVLPFTTDRVPARLASARSEVARGRVKLEARQTLGSRIQVSGRVGAHSVRASTIFELDGKIVDGSCECRWFHENRLSRGPCRHVLALRFAADDVRG
ncbi:MAG: SWIM zinc finger family protein [Deltaproteobacteria bacterium]|nr:SWIM zinc finger family protein [Deltaproteobacteria bacterium]